MYGFGVAALKFVYTFINSLQFYSARFCGWFERSKTETNCNEWWYVHKNVRSLEVHCKQGGS